MFPYHGIFPIYFWSHSSDQTQPLAVSISGLQKRELSAARPPNLLSGQTAQTAQTAQIVRILSALQRAAIPLNPIGAFRRAGVIASDDFEKQTLVIQIDRSKADTVRTWNPSKHRISTEEQPRKTKKSSANILIASFSECSTQMTEILLKSSI
jgi:hypothetical protein